MNISYYNKITDNIFIGELNAGKDPNDFDIIINFAYINDFFNNGLKHRQERETLKNNKTLYEFALYDSDSDAEYFSSIINTFIPYIIIKFKNKKILFHCQSGKSRSVAMALAYLCITKNISVEDGLSLIKKIRPIINPRPIFIDIVKDFVDNYNKIKE